MSAWPHEVVLLDPLDSRKKEIKEWLVDHWRGDWNLRWNIHTQGGRITYMFHDPQMALLFKLTWVGAPES